MSMNLFKKSKRLRDDAGIALITTLLLLFLMSSLLVGFTVLLMTNQQLAGSNNDDVTAFYGAEAGMEQMTANLGDLFSQTYSPTAAQINAVELNPPLIWLGNGKSIQFLNSNGTSGYTITPGAVDANGNPAPTISTIKSGPYSGMTALLTEYTMVVNARTTEGREAKLQRTVQTVGIPMFQFGIFSDTDLSFFPGPNFNFGGRTHTNGNLFLAAGSTLTLSDKVDAYKDVIRTNLENGWPTSVNYTGTVQITTQPGGSNYRPLQPSEGSLTGTLGSGANANWPTISTGNAPTYYNSNLINGQGSAHPSFSTGAKQLNLGIVTIGSGATQEIDLIRRPLSGEAANVTGERYFAQASLKVLLSDDPADIMNLPCIDGSTQPFDLSKMASQPSTWPASTYAPLVALYNQMIANGVTPLPLAASGALGGPGGAYNPQDGYWLPGGGANPYPVIKGYLKIEEQLGYGSPCGTWKDVTVEILSYGYVGRNIDPVPQSLDGTNLNPQWPAVGTATCVSTVSCAQMDPLKGMYVPPVPGPGNPAGGYTVAGNQLATIAYGYPLPKVPMTAAPAPLPLAAQNPNPPAFLAAGPFNALDTLAAPTGTCMDPHPLAVIRLERIRDNPSSLYVGGYVASGTWNAATNKALQAPVSIVCGVDPATGKLPLIGGVSWVPTLYDFWPNTLFDTREGTLRDTAMNTANPAMPTLNGTMHYIELDGKNLSSWFGGKIGTIVTSGAGTKDPAVAPNDFVVYVSDRRGNYSLSQTITGGWPPLSYTHKETGEYGWNDIINNPATSTASGCPDSALEQGEDADGTGVLYTYGANESYLHAVGAIPVPPATVLPLGQIGIFANLVGGASGITSNVSCPTVPSYATDGIWPMMVATASSSARENPALFFRRAVKIVNGSNLSAVGTCPGGNNCGLTIASENPVYVQGDFNANLGGIGFANSPTTIAASVAGDAVTLLSNNWNDTNSFSSPYALAGRSGVTTWYRVAVIAGAPSWFSNSSDSAHQDFGTDGGVHNFLRYIEAWGGTLEYRGSIIDLFTSRQANGTFKCCSTVYSPPDRGYNFDTNFLTPALLPPRTPLFRDVNTTGWTRLLLPNQ
ncbi:MAG TPA: hypothetical protein VJX72_07155 [Candidatus Acidoferrum sp.]|nr:hypothetical protein [Candidatus Acidoferrum sp.]